MGIYTTAGSIERSMVSHLPDLEKRLQRRYDQLVREHVAPLQAVAAGLRALPELAQPFARTPAAWSFDQNPRVGLQALAGPLLAAARAAVPASAWPTPWACPTGRGCTPPATPAK